MTAYDAAEWSDLFVAVAGAAAALAGLLFVAVSLNLKQILESPGMSAIASRPLGVLLAFVLLSLVVLTPGQSRVALGIEITVLGAVLAVMTLVSVFRTHFFPVQQWTWSLLTVALAVLSTFPMVICGISLIAGVGGGLYWAVAELVLGFTISIRYAWVVLVEILR